MSILKGKDSGESDRFGSQSLLTSGNIIGLTKKSNLVK